MKWLQLARRSSSVLLLTAAALPALGGCAGPKVIFEGIGLMRTNGELIIFQDQEIEPELKSELALTDGELALIQGFPDGTGQELSSIQAVSGGSGSSQCLTMAGGHCRPVSCKDCSLWVVTSGGATPYSQGNPLPPPPFAFDCRCGD